MRKNSWFSVKKGIAILLAIAFAFTINTNPVAYGIDGNKELLIDLVSDLSVAVNGSTDANAMIYIMNTGDTELGSGFADGYGKFSVRIPKQIPGNRIVIYAAEKIIEDGVEDYAPFATKQMEVIDLSPPKPPSVKLYKNKLGITGKTEKKAVVFVYAEGFLVANKGASSNGKFSVDLPFLMKGMKLGVKAVDTGGRFSKTTKLNVK